MKKRTMVIVGILWTWAGSSAYAFPWYAKGEGIWGAGLMTPEERMAYVHSIQGMKSYGECQSYVASHRQDIQARARERNVSLPPPPDRSPCDVMQVMGRFNGNAASCPTQK